MNKAVGRRVVRLRQEKDWTQATLASEAGVTPNTIRGLEKGSLNTRWPKLQKIARALGTTAEMLLRGEEKIEPTDPRLLGLNDEDLQIARLHHDAPTAVRQRVQALLTSSGEDRVSAIANRLALLPPRFLETHEQMLADTERALQDAKPSAATKEVDGKKK